MGLNKRNKVNAVFNMASLTDMIFLLLIFFVLNSAVVAPSSLNLKLPGSSKERAEADSDTPDIRVTRAGSFYINGKRKTAYQLEEEIAAKAGNDFTVTISPEKNTPIKHVVTAMDLARKYEVNAILAAED
jgi:biopolymer transport protein ExbD